MSRQDFLALAPMLVLTATAVILMLQAAVKRNNRLAWGITVVGLLTAAWSASLAVSYSRQVTPLVIVDPWGLFFTLVVLGAALVTLVLSGAGGFLPLQRQEEFYLLLVLSLLGAVVLVQSSHMATFILGMELMGIALYAMIAFPEKGQVPLEAAIKYLVLSAAASAMLLFGFALLYAATGDLSYSGMAVKMSAGFEVNPTLVVAGLALVLAGIGFKLSLVPFHMWTPDVYQGAPTSVTVYLATVSKGAVFVALTRIVLTVDLAGYPSVLVALSAVAVASMLIGNLLALLQDNLKRLLAYSSIAHFGYLLVILIAIPASKPLVSSAVTYYLAAYMVTTLAAFTAAALVAGENDEGYPLKTFEGLFWRQPFMALVLTVSMLSLAGIPLTAGFIGKFYVINVGIDARLWLLLAVLLVGSAIAIYYYLRVVFVMSRTPASSREPVQRTPGFAMMAAVLLLLVVLLGSWPEPFMAFMGSL